MHLAANDLAVHPNDAELGIDPTRETDTFQGSVVLRWCSSCQHLACNALLSETTHTSVCVSASPPSHGTPSLARGRISTCHSLPSALILTPGRRAITWPPESHTVSPRLQSGRIDFPRSQDTTPAPRASWAHRMPTVLGRTVSHKQWPLRHSGLWDEFWQWQDERDKRRFQRRLVGAGLNRHRGPPESRLVTRGTESLELDGLSAMFEVGMA